MRSIGIYDGLVKMDGKEIERDISLYVNTDKIEAFFVYDGMKFVDYKGGSREAKIKRSNIKIITGNHVIDVEGYEGEGDDVAEDIMSFDDSAYGLNVNVTNLDEHAKVFNSI